MIVRELITKIGFKVDRAGLDSFEKSIVGFKTKFALASAAVTATVSKTLGYFKDIAKASISTQGLAEQTGVATEKFVALRKAAEELGQVDPDQFDAYFKRLSGLLRQAQAGYGELHEILNRSEGKLNLTPFIQNHDVEGAFKAIIDYTNALDKVPDKVAVVADVLGESNPTGLLNLIKKGSQAFTEATVRNKAFGKQFVDNQPALEDYTKKLNDFSNALEGFQNAFVKNILPLVTGTVSLTTQVLKGDFIEGYKVIGNEVAENGVLSALKFINDAIGGTVLKGLGYETTDKDKMKWHQNDMQFNRFLGDYQRQQQINSVRGPTTINSKVEVNVAGGTGLDQAQVIGAEVRGAIDQMWQEKVREVINNNPQAE